MTLDTAVLDELISDGSVAQRANGARSATARRPGS